MSGAAERGGKKENPVRKIAKIITEVLENEETEFPVITARKAFELSETAQRVANDEIELHDWLSDRGHLWWSAVHLASQWVAEELDDKDPESWPPYVSKKSKKLRVLPRFGYVVDEVETLGEEAVGKMIRFRGVVTARSGPKAEITWGRFECPRCGETTTLTAERPVAVKQRIRCRECGTEMQPSYEAITTMFELDVQELPEKAGTEAGRIRVFLRWPGYQFNSPKPGDRVEIVGVPSTRMSRGHLGEEGEIVLEGYAAFPISKEPEVSGSPDGVSMEDVKSLLAPELAGKLYDRLRELIVYQMVSTDFEAGLRGRIHVLLIGPPASGKSRLLQAAAEVWGVYASAEHVTGPGLTVAAERTRDGWVLKAGAAVAADGQILAVDELDKADKEDINHMLELMESGKISVAKAGITTEIRSSPAVLAAANPNEQELDRLLALAEDEDEEFSREAVIAEACGITAPLASRFDLVVPVPRLEEPKTVVASMSGAINAGEDKERKKKVAKARAWIMRARKVEPEAKVDPEKAEEIIDKLELPKDPRSVGAVMRVAAAMAKVDYVDGRLQSPKITNKHFERAARLISELSMIDVSELEKVRQRTEPPAELSITDLRRLVEQKAEELEEFTVDELLEEIERVVGKKEYVDRARELLEDLKNEGRLLEPEPGRLRYIG